MSDTNAKRSGGHSVTPCPRPWYLSIAAKWSEAEGFGSLKPCLEALLRELPFHHLLIPIDSWHSSLFAVAKFTEFPNGKAAALHAREIFQELVADPNLVEELQKSFEPFSVQPDKLSCFDNGTTVNFHPSNQLTKLRDAFRRALLSPFESVAEDRKGIQSLLQDENKSRGSKFFGSIARSPYPADLSMLRWERSLPELLPLVFRRVYFLVSDEALMNPRTSADSISISK